MPIDLAAVDWLYVVILAVLVFVSTLVGNILSFNHRGLGAVLSAVAFAGLFVFWTYYPHGLPLPTTLTPQKAAVAPAAPAAPGAPERPRNPVTTIPTPATPAR
jgi:hypothetical protein